MRPGRPTRFAEAHTVNWAAAVHFLLVRIDGESAEVVPIGEDGGPLATVDTTGRPVPAATAIGAATPIP